MINITSIDSIEKIGTSEFYTNDNPSGFITGLENVVYTTGSQSISGDKTFYGSIFAVSGFEVGSGSSVLFVSTSGVGINTENPQAAFDVSGEAFFTSRPKVNGTGVLLSGDLSNYYTNDNPSGFVNSSDLLGYVAKSGDTMTGKLNLPASSPAFAPLNLGNGVSPTSPVAGDLYFDGSLKYRDNVATVRTVAATNKVNVFSDYQSIVTSNNSNPALRITQTGTGEALRVEDETTPDATAFVVSNLGRVGIGVTPDASACLSLDSTGVKFGDGTIQTTADLPAIRGQVSSMTTGTITIGTAGTYQSTGLTATLDATTAAGMSLGTTDLFAVKNTSSATRVLKIYASMDASAGNNETLGIKLAKNGTPIDETECRANTGNHNFAKIVTNWMVSMAPNDEVALFVANHSSTNTIAFQRGRVTASFVD